LLRLMAHVPRMSHSLKKKITSFVWTAEIRITVSTWSHQSALRKRLLSR
jgi:hypothetical protein